MAMPQSTLFGAITVVGDGLTFTPQTGPAVTLHAPDALQLCYGYSPQDWMDSNRWTLVHRAGAQRLQLELADHESLTVLLVSWCAAHLPGFDAAAFRHLAGSPGRAEHSNQIVWARPPQEASG
jgi:hypothetical protein